MSGYEVIALGNVHLDRKLVVGDFPSEERAVIPEKAKRVVGGSCGNFIISCSRLGIKTKSIAAIGKDRNGNYIKNILSEEGIDTSDLLMKENQETIEVICLNKKTRGKGYLGPINQDIAILREKDINKNMCLNDVSTNLLYVSGYSLSKMPLSWERKAVIKAINEIDYGKLMFDPGPRAHQIPENTLKNVLNLAEIITLNEREAKSIIKKKKIDYKALAKEIHKKGPGPKEIFIKLGKKGAYLYSKRKNKKITANDVEVRDENATGDVFNSGIAYGQINNLEKTKQLKLANKLAEKKAQTQGSGQKLPNKKEYQKTTKKIKQRT
ncbi:MAG: Sugar kinase ribokinase family [Candidatus Methanohalarchaeum thermophilum]|uniref:Sugar kinase ribokinase family n=1 Tax=Methanohalarchaeum thermophilum TaxID=1903181 RepID=A0A1Q6DT15_METT1|nr:MAG: Sugar kinase ribokinase family [Candidatus Methanohalarchaeum thermophilum]